MGSLYLLKCLVEWFFDMESSGMPLIQRKTILKDFENHKLRYTMKYWFFNKFFYSFELNNLTSHFFKCEVLIPSPNTNQVKKLKKIV